MKIIEVDDELYAYIASQTQSIGESASQILRRLLMSDSGIVEQDSVQEKTPLKTRVTADKLAQIPNKVGQFLFILGELSELHQNTFACVEDVRGKDRLYFASSKQSLEASGKSINAKPIPNSSYWVVTNNNSAKKVSILKQVMTLLGYEQGLIDSVIDIFNAK